MKKSSLIIFLAFVLGILGVTGYRYDQYVLEHNYLIQADISCDPVTEKCFVADCEEGDDTCDATPYKKVEILAANAPSCLEEHTCEAFTCSGSSCEIAYCSDDTLEDGEVCALEGEPVEPEAEPVEVPEDSFPVPQ